jgi:hypothetical protein
VPFFPQGGLSGCNVAEVLNKMHDHLLSLLNKEAPWTVRVFGSDAQEVQCVLVSQILASLDPTLPDCLAQAVGAPGGDTSHVRHCCATRNPALCRESS